MARPQMTAGERVPSHCISPLRLVFLTSAAMLSFATDSLLCRLALKHTTIDAATFTTACPALASATILSGIAVVVLPRRR